jgi:hypothetical protein
VPAVNFAGCDGPREETSYGRESQDDDASRRSWHPLVDVAGRIPGLDSIQLPVIEHDTSICKGAPGNFELEPLSPQLHAPSMAAEPEDSRPQTPKRAQSDVRTSSAAATPLRPDSRAPADDTDGEEEEEDEDGVEDEPRLKYTRLTEHLGPVYRNGDATSSFAVAGDKMVRSRVPK